jgi:hypothetical protein
MPLPRSGMPRGMAIRYGMTAIPITVHSTSLALAKQEVAERYAAFLGAESYELRAYELSVVECPDNDGAWNFTFTVYLEI